MAKVEQITCDICGVKKGEVNHWLMARIIGSSFLLYPWTDETQLGGSATHHLCGQEHAHKLLDEFLQKPVAQS